MRHRSVVLQLVAIECIVADASAVPAIGESALHGNCRGGALRDAVASLAHKLETRLINGFGIQDLRITDLKLVFGI